MRIIFMGTAALACPCLEAVAGLAGHEIVGVITQPDRPKGRDLLPAPPPVKVIAQKLGLPVQQPQKMRDDAAIKLVRAARPDLIIVVAYGQILPKAVLDIAPRGCVNVHTSLLPRWRGASPIQQAILAGDSETGVTTMFMDEQMDTGDIILQRTEPIRTDDTSAKLQERLAKLGAALLVETVALIEAGQAPRTKQDDAQATYAKKISKEDGRIDWAQPAAYIERQTRAFDPWPSAYTFWAGTMVKIWRAEVAKWTGGRPGELAVALTVAAGADALNIQEVQPAGGKRMSFKAFARGHGLHAGVVLE